MKGIILDITLANHRTRRRFIHAVEIKRAEDIKQVGKLKSLLTKQIIVEAKQMAKELNDMNDKQFSDNFLENMKV